MSPEISTVKAALRAEIRTSRLGRNAHDLGFARQLAPLISRATHIAGYIGYKDEPRINESLIAALADRKTVLLPRLRPDLDLEWAQWTGEPLTAHGNIAQPESGTLEAIGSADLIIIPALAVAKSGVRLGQGGGSYDRALRRATGKIVAVVYDDEFVEDLPSESHDIKVNLVVTPIRTISF